MGGIAVVLGGVLVDGRCEWILGNILLEIKWWADHACIYIDRIDSRAGRLSVHTRRISSLELEHMSPRKWSSL